MREDSHHPLCRRFGFDDPARREARLRLVDLAPADGEHAERLRREVLVPRADEIVERFHAHLREDPSYAAVMARGGDPGRLQAAHRDYLRGFGRGHEGLDYFESRLRMGVVRAHHGVPAGVYLGACAALAGLVRRAAEEALPAEARAPALCAFTKLLLLDTSLVMEAYVQAEVAELAELVAAERERARTDALTGVRSRAAALEALEEALAQAALERVPASVVMVDLDGFKAVNDTWGHPVGDAVLREAAQRIRAAVRDFDVVGRYGGEEFLVVLAGTPLDVARRIAERIRARIEEAPFAVEGGRVGLTTSAGVAEAAPGEGPAEVVARADRALYEAKRAGKNRVRVDLG